MAASILLACGLNETNLPSLIYLEEENGVDGSFLITSILSQRLKMISMSKINIILCCCYQTFDHYHNAGLRLGYNLRSYKDTKRLHTIEPLNDIYQNFFDSPYLSTSNTEGKTENSIDYFWESIKNKIYNLNNSNKTLLIIDDLTLFSNLGCSEESLIKFFYKLNQLKSQYENTITIIIKINISDSYKTLVAHMNDVNLKIKIEKLKSGNFREVDGKISIYKMDERNLFEEIKIFKTILYKVTDKAIKIFAPGEVGIKV